MYRLVDYCYTGGKHAERERFSVHIGIGSEYRDLSGERYEYSIPTFKNKTDWMLGLAGVSATGYPGTDFYDLSSGANIAAIAEALRWWMDGFPADVGLYIDCINYTPPGQFWNAVELFRLVKQIIAPRIVCINFGDVYSWTTTDPDSPWRALIDEADAQMPQVAVDYANPTRRLRQLARLVSGVKDRIAAGKRVFPGVWDPGRGSEALVRQLFEALPEREHPRFAWLYDSDPRSGWDPLLQWPGWLPVAQPLLGINSDLISSALYERPDNWCNVRVDAAPLDPDSAGILSRIASYASTGGRLHPDFNDSYGMPYIVVDSSTPRVPVAFNYASESDPGPYPIPDAAKADRRYYENHEFGNDSGRDGDAHVLIYDREERKLYELSYLYWNGSQWKAGAGAIFDLKTNGRRPEGWTSTDAAGLAVLPLLIRPDECFEHTGRIEHALRFSIKRTNGHIYPASHTGARDAGAPPLGMRARLKADVDIEARIADAPEPHRSALRRVFVAMREYGGIVADRGGNGYFQGVLDPRFDAAVWNRVFHRFSLEADFEIVKLGWWP